MIFLCLPKFLKMLNKVILKNFAQIYYKIFTILQFLTDVHHTTNKGQSLNQILFNIDLF